jgi:signal transduction histidine kinase
MHGGTPYRTGQLDMEVTGTLVPALLANKVAVIVPLQHEGRLFGLLGLGEKVTRRPFADDELEMFATLSNTVTPLLVSSFLFLEIATLNMWYRDILNSVKQGVFVFDGERRLKEINAAGLDIMKALHPESADAESLEGLTLQNAFGDRCCPGWARRIENALDGRHASLLQHVVARTPESEHVYHIRVSRAAGAESDAPNHAGDGDIIVTLEDVSEQRENDSRFHELVKFAERGMMAASIAHELNNFLAMILGGVELAQMVIKMDQAERAQKSLEKVKSAVTRMERFTSGLTDLSRLQATRQLTQLNTTISDLLDFASVQKRFQRIRIETDLDPELPQYLCDRDQFSQLLMNLLNNAADAIAEARREDGLIHLTTAHRSDRILISVRDNGVGMRPEVRDQLFKHHLTTKEKGHGYGLVTCARILVEHGAEFQIESEPGQGTTFNFNFPIVAESTTEPA